MAVPFALHILKWVPGRTGSRKRNQLDHDAFASRSDDADGTVDDRSCAASGAPREEFA